MTQDDSIEAYSRGGETSEQTVARLNVAAAQARDDEIAAALGAVEDGQALLAQAVVVFGGLRAACDWMSSAAIGLNGRRPVDLLKTPGDAGAVAELLGRLYNGVYS